jgi:ribonuclease D
MIEYASADTSHLPALRDILETELRNRGRLEWADEEFARLEAVRWTGADGTPDDYTRLKGARTLLPQSQLLLRGLYGWREDRAKSLDRAPFRVLQNETLLALAQAAPRDPAALRAVAGMSSTLVERYGRELLEVIEKGLEAPAESWPRKDRLARPRIDAETEQRFERLKQLRNARARELGLEPGVLGANAALQTLARNAGTAGYPGEPGAELRQWQRAAIGEQAILAALSGPPKPAGEVGS